MGIPRYRSPALRLLTSSPRRWMSVALVLAATYLVSGTEFDLSAAREVIKSKLLSNRPPGMCTMEEYDVGTWVRREQGVLRDMEELRAEYEMRPLDLRCAALNGGTDHTARSLDVASWVWKPTSGCHIAEWDLDSFVVSLLQMYAGLWMVGDSITHQMAEQLIAMVALPGTPLYQQNNQYFVSADLPHGQELLQRAGVDVSRAKRPIMTWVFNVRLLDHEEFKKCWEETGIPVSEWLITSPVPQWTEQWLSEYTRFSLEHQKVVEEGSSPYTPSVILFR
ncbi:hypothetical protein MNV49_001738 [Pseudohyphozyma bogoriensis]|nr:hypothetical protein MNV49_001738 [Pseudohyphozyma bogoriensis]